MNEGCQEFVFRIGLIHVSKIHAYTDGSLIFVHRNKIGYPFSQGNQVDKPTLRNFYTSTLITLALIGLIDLSRF
jgi:hypothetical protein